ncbi:PBP1A family penicillin-binding protein [Actibacterium sp. XHP0104]|nr:PBP1A family penicillin-binding protein [Actibacterium sp. XHP0104]MCV2881647.1 PBP1A family penicillin-binding protein [Actibacterium sp. XHP0104]
MGSSNGRRPPLVADKRTKRPAAKPAAKPARPRKTRRSPRKAPPKGPLGWLRRLLGRIAGMIWTAAWRVGLVVVILIALSVGYFAASLPPVSELVDGRTRGSVTLLDRSGEVFAWRGDQFGGQINANTVAPVLREAVVATEDKRFYRHFGISPRGIASAVRINLSEGRGPLSGNGGSTITQQTAKLLCLGVPYDADTWKSETDYEADCRRTTLQRKIKEAIYAMAMEARYSKNEILTIYLNRAYLGAGARGFEAASQRYFGKSANEVSASEAAMLAGLLKAPSTYAPTSNLKRAQDRANLIVGLMEDQGYLSAAEARNARANPAELSEAAAARAGGYFADWVMEDGPSFLTRDTTEDVIIRTTFDPRIQTAAEDALAHIFDTKVSEGSKAQAAIVVMSSDGAVRAMVGGRQTKVSGAFNRATMALRQTGSSFKPFVYAAALDLGFTPNATVVDEPITIHVPGSGPYTPRNYDNKFHGRVTLTTALAQSFNIPAIRVSESVGRENVRKIAADFGIESDLAVGPALALGTSESTLIEMTGAYAGILNGGLSVRPYGLTELRLQGDDTPLMGQEGGMGERVISERAARSLTYMMTQVIERGSGQRARLPDRPAAGKTGTTQAARDAWFIGFTADYVVGVWMGYDDNTPLTGVTGGGLPADIWRETMVRVHEGVPARALPMDVPVAPPILTQEEQRKVKREERRKRRKERDEDLLRGVLRSILGGG